MMHEIGKTAGDVWQVLHNEGEITLARLKKAVPVKEEILLMALGWLAREDQLNFSSTGRSIRLSIKRSG